MRSVSGSILIGFLFLVSCSAPSSVTKSDASAPSQPKLALSVRVACVDMSGYGKRIEKKDIERFSAALKREQIEILAVQGITRYPNDAGVRDVAIVSTRLPAKASSDELPTCMRTIAGLRKNPDTPFVVTGNLSTYKKSRDFGKFTDLQSSLPDGSGKLLTSRLWFMQGDLFRDFALFLVFGFHVQRDSS